MRRCAASIAANIAERLRKAEQWRLSTILGIAAGSASELEYHFLLARDLELMTADQYKALNSSVLEVKRMLATLILKIENERLAG